jgi:hypothetical protein
MEDIVKIVNLIYDSLSRIVDESLRKKNKRLFLILFSVIYFYLFNPYQYPIRNLYTLYKDVVSIKWYNEIFWATLLLLLIVIIVQIYLAQKNKILTRKPDEIRTGPIKGLLSYSSEDAEYYSNLQRDQNLVECFQAITNEHWRFGVLDGDSGVGKTSFLLAGLMPLLEKHGIICIYVKFTELDPFESIRRACAKHLVNVIENSEDYICNLREASIKAQKPIIIIFDQFEQFFLHQKKRNDRERLINSLQLWYQTMKSIPVKILISIRSDNLSRLFELQQALKYTLSPTQSFQLNKFEPLQAANILRYIADTEQIKYDVNFLRDLSIQYLADTEDGLVSPVDIQIIARIVQREVINENRAFDKSTFQKYGGYDGLLERYLDSLLNVYDKQGGNNQVVIKVLSSLMDLDNNMSIGALSVEKMHLKIGSDIKVTDINKAITWLEQDDVRLIIGSREDSVKVYELTHDKIIPAFRKIANKDISASENANLLLSRRAIEWHNNKENRRYLLSLPEILNIYKFREFILSGKQQSLKEKFLAASIQRLKRTILACLCVALVFVFGSKLWESNSWQLYLTKRQILISLKDDWLLNRRYSNSTSYLNDEAWIDILSSLTYVGEDFVALKYYNSFDDSSKEKFLNEYASTILSDCNKINPSVEVYIQSIEKITNQQVKDSLYFMLARVLGYCALKKKDLNALKTASTIINMGSSASSDRYFTQYDFALLFALLNDEISYNSMLDQANTNVANSSTLLSKEPKITKNFVVDFVKVINILPRWVYSIQKAENDDQVDYIISELITQNGGTSANIPIFILWIAGIIASADRIDLQNTLIQKASNIFSSQKPNTDLHQRRIDKQNSENDIIALPLANLFSALPDKTNARYIINNFNDDVMARHSFQDNLLLEIYVNLNDKDEVINLITNDQYINNMLNRLSTMSLEDSQSLTSLYVKAIGKQDEWDKIITPRIISYFNTKYKGIGFDDILKDIDFEDKSEFLSSLQEFRNTQSMSDILADKRKNDTAVLLYCLIAEIYAKLNASDKAEEYINKSIEIIEQSLSTASYSSINYYRVGESIGNVADALNDPSILDKGINIITSSMRTSSCDVKSFGGSSICYSMLKGLLSSPITCISVAKLRSSVHSYSAKDIQLLRMNSIILKYCSQSRKKFKNNLSLDSKSLIQIKDGYLAFPSFY